ncbi:MAG: hypothetical protein OEO23_05290 [Gemmatimonadota bacterium]|nr:hypothetical protein [Gemmatimonadota bacterium]
MRVLSAAVLAAMIVCPQLVAAQEEEQDSLRSEIARLEARLDSLVAQIEGMELAVPAEDDDPIARLRAAAAAAGAEQPRETGADPEDQQFSGRQRSLQALNPEISVTGDIFAQFREGSIDENNFIPREFEFSFISALDPYSRAKIYVAHHEEGGDLEIFEGLGGHGEEEGEGGHGGASTEIEEGYLEWVNLPGGLSVTVGRFRQRFGTFNRWHGHALPGSGYFLPYQVFLGEEGLAQTGVSVHWLAPFGPGAYEAWFEVTRSGNESMFGESNEPSFLGHVNAFWELSPSTYFELGLSGLTGDHVEEDGRFRNQLLSAEAALNWRPPERGRYREVNLRGALLFNDRAAHVTATGTEPATSAMGAWALADFRFSEQWIVGTRFDWVENPTLADESAWMLAPTLTWWQSEWVRIRAEYNLLDNPEGRTNQLLLQFTLSMGPHKHETY